MGHNIVLIVANEPGPGHEDEYNRWYTGTHIPMMFKFKGLKKVSRYRRMAEGNETSKYLAVYEFDSKEDLAAFSLSPEFSAAVVDFDKKWQGGGFESKWAASYELIKAWEK